MNLRYVLAVRRRATSLQLGCRIQVSSLRDAAQLEQRAVLAAYASKIAAFASGVHRIDRLEPPPPLATMMIADFQSYRHTNVHLDLLVI